MGVERLLALIEMEGAGIAQGGPDAYVVRQGEQAQRYAEGVAETLRSAGLTVVLHCGGGNFKAQMKKADASGARYAIVIGDDEAQAAEVSVKPLREVGPQVRVPVNAAIDIMKSGAGAQRPPAA
jgi:histidyl-tRNA synthetase